MYMKTVARRFCDTLNLSAQVATAVASDEATLAIDKNAETPTIAAISAGSPSSEAGGSAPTSETHSKSVSDPAESSPSDSAPAALNKDKAYKARQIEALTAMKSIGVVSPEARHELVSKATGGVTESTKELTQGQLDLILKEVAVLAKADES